MPARQQLSPTPASQVRISTKIATWFLGAILISSLGLILTKIITDPDPARKLSQASELSPSP